MAATHKIGLAACRLEYCGRCFHEHNWVGGLGWLMRVRTATCVQEEDGGWMKARGTSRGMDKREQRGHFFDQTTDAAEVNPPQLATPVLSQYSHGQQQASNHRIYRDLAFITVH